jgi:ubiquinone/menaquinone biosynthesis C-methylase UbiE
MTTSSDQLHINHWDTFFDDELHARLYPTWWDDSTANHWRHRRFMEPVLDVLQTKDQKWLTIGDGSGHDTWIMRNEGFKDILTTDIGSGTLKRSLAEGYIDKFDQANAENLQFADEQFDFVLCKEAFHHMRRPYMGIYEMMRVAKRAVVLIEPQDQWADFPPRAGKAAASYERVGNYVYSLSQREVQKISLGMNLPGYACKNMQDVYIQGCEFAKAEPTDPVFATMVNTVKALEQRCNQNQEKWNYIMTIFFKDESLFTNPALVDRMQSYGWQFEKTNTNPHLTGGGSSH